jgi:branched-chain amino acid transport system substrate-binding protein
MKRSMLVCIIGLLVSSASWGGLLPPDAVAEKVARGVYQYEEGEYSLAASEFEAVLAASPDDVLASRAMIMLARCQYALERYDQASKSLARFAVEYPRSTYRDEAAFLLGNTLFLSGDVLGAAQAYASAVGDRLAEREVADAAMESFNSTLVFIPPDSLEILRDRLPDGAPADEAAFLAGKTYLEQGRTGPARRALSAYLARFSAGRYNTAVRSMLEQLESAPIREGTNVIAVLAPLSGPYADFGRCMVEGVSLALDHFGQRGLEGVEVKSYDTEGSTVGAVIRAREAIADRPLAVVGPLLSDEVAGVSAVFADEDIPIVAPAAAQSDVAALGSNVFQLATTTSRLGSSLARFAKERLGLVAVVVIAPDDGFGIEISAAFVETARELGMTVIATETYTRGTTDFKKLLKRVQKAQKEQLGRLVSEGTIPRTVARGKEKDWWPLVCGVFVPGYGEDLAMLLPQLPFFRVYGRTLGTSGLASDQPRMQAADQLEGAVFVSDFYLADEDVQTSGWRDSYRVAFGRAPQRVSALAYDAASLVCRAVLDGASTSGEVLSALATVSSYSGVTGRVDFTHGRVNTHPTFYEIRSGRARRFTED